MGQHGGLRWGASGGTSGPQFPPALLQLTNCSVVSNQAIDPPGPTSSGGIAGERVKVSNSILWDNRAANGSFIDESTQIFPGALFLDVQFTTIQGLISIPGFGNLDLNPEFVSLVGGNLRLTSGSPCIDAGFNIVDIDPNQPGFQPLPSTDLDGNPRTVDATGFGESIVDMGAYEFQP